jgi:hypothetical protein
VNSEGGAILPEKKSQIVNITSDVIDVALPQRGINHII